MENVPNPGTYIAKLGQDITNARNAIQVVLDDNTYLVQNGGAAFLEAPPFNFTSADAAAWIAAFGNWTNPAIATAIADSVPTWGGN